MRIRKKLRAAVSGNARMWDALPWKAVDLESNKLGDFDESVFFGLEEIDGNAYKLSKSGVTHISTDTDVNNAITDCADIEQEATLEGAVEKVVKKTKKDKKRKQDDIQIENDVKENSKVTEPAEEEPLKVKKGKKTKKEQTLAPAREGLLDMDEVVNATDSGKLGSLKALYINAPAPLVKEDVAYLKDDAEWAPGLRLSSILTQALHELGFQTPTPIQTAAIPLTTACGTDIVGAAETGSGKTLVRFASSFFRYIANTHTPIVMAFM